MKKEAVAAVSPQARAGRRDSGWVPAIGCRLVLFDLCNLARFFKSTMCLYIRFKQVRKFRITLEFRNI